MKTFMDDTELKIYMENRTRQFSDPQVLAGLEKLVNEILQVTQFTIMQKFIIVTAFEFLCFTLDTSEGRAMYIKLLNHIAPYFPNMAEKYWAIFDNQENLITRYKIDIRI
jgi:hypothetical protein